MPESTATKAVSYTTPRDTIFKLPDLTAVSSCDMAVSLAPARQKLGRMAAGF